MIELINVSKYYPTDFGRHYVFRDVSLVLPLDKSVAVIGPNGAGKSTFLRLIGGADIPSEGRIIKTGRISPPMGLTPGLQGSLTGAENARFAGRIHGMSRDEIADLIEHVRELADIGKFFDMPVGTYSAGMRQRVAFAINMSMEYDYYLFDEIGAGGDKEFRKTAKALVQQRLETSNFIIVSHRSDELLDICDAGIVIRDGTLTYYEDVADALAAYSTDDDDEVNSARQKRRSRKKAKAEAAALAPEERKARRRERRKKPSDTEAPAVALAPGSEDAGVIAGDPAAVADQPSKSKRRRKSAQPDVASSPGQDAAEELPAPDPQAEAAAKEAKRQERRAKRAARKNLVSPVAEADTLPPDSVLRETAAEAAVLTPEEEAIAAAKRERQAKREARRAKKLKAEEAVAVVESEPVSQLPDAEPAEDELAAAKRERQARREARRAKKIKAEEALVVEPEPVSQLPDAEPAEDELAAAKRERQARREARRAKRLEAEESPPVVEAETVADEAVAAVDEDEAEAAKRERKARREARKAKKLQDATVAAPEMGTAPAIVSQEAEDEQAEEARRQRKAKRQARKSAADTTSEEDVPAFSGAASASAMINVERTWPTSQVGPAEAAGLLRQAALHQEKARSKAARAARLLLQHLAEQSSGGSSSAANRASLIAAAQESAAAEAELARQSLVGALSTGYAPARMPDLQPIRPSTPERPLQRHSEIRQ